jgi:hypothetical protein
MKWGQMQSRVRSKQDMLLAALCVLGTVVTWRFSDYLGPTEFSGGTVTGPVFAIHELAGDLFPLAAIAAFFYRRVAAAMALVACLLAPPLYVYFLAPGPFRTLFPGEYSVPLTRSYVWDPWSLAGLAVIAAATSISLRALPQDR